MPRHPLPRMPESQVEPPQVQFESIKQDETAYALAQSYGTFAKSEAWKDIQLQLETLEHAAALKLLRNGLDSPSALYGQHAIVHVSRLVREQIEARIESAAEFMQEFLGKKEEENEHTAN